MSKYVGHGIRTDCNTIIKRFRELNTLRYDEFAIIWRDMKFPYIYYGHSNLEELLEFTEEALRIAKEVWLKSENINEQAGGLYTLHGLYLKQPTDGLVKVRLTPRDYELVKKFHEAVTLGSHHDANYILARMHIIGAFRFCVSSYPYGVEKVYRRYHESDRSLKEVKDEPFYVKKLRNDDIFLKLDDALHKYHKSKCLLVSDNSQSAPQLLNYVDTEFAQKLKENFQKITQDTEEVGTKETENESGQETSKTKVNDKKASQSTKSGFNPPWWMLRVRNRTQKPVSSSDSEAENVDDVIKDSEKNTSTDQENRDALIADLGMSGDEDEGDCVGRSLEEMSSEPSCSHDMPSLL